SVSFILQSIGWKEYSTSRRPRISLAKSISKPTFSPASFLKPKGAKVSSKPMTTPSSLFISCAKLGFETDNNNNRATNTILIFDTIFFIFLSPFYKSKQQKTPFNPIGLKDVYDVVPPFFIIISQ